MENVVTRESFWRGKQVFVTGHTGFKGAWLAMWLSELGADVTGCFEPDEADARPVGWVADRLPAFTPAIT
jgi:nucleoside-diphosphate-sugar epimerase